MGNSAANYIPADYRGTNGVLTIVDDESSLSVTIPIITDAARETNETFTVVLRNPAGGVQLAGITARL